MDIGSAALLIENLLDRIELDQQSGKFKLGTISSKEKRALEVLLATFGEAGATRPPVSEPLATLPPSVAAIPAASAQPTIHPSVQVELKLGALDRSSAADAHVTVCLDFGTAMSKAFAIHGDFNPIELALGRRAGSSGSPYPIDSSVFISDDGVLHFGPQAVELGTAAAAMGRARFDSPKARLSMGQQLDIYRAQVAKDVNPVHDIPVTEGELITLYLGYLTDLATTELEANGFSRFCVRRFARPCWSDERNKWAEPLLRKMLAQAQILADTFHDQWRGGIPLAKAKSALQQVKELPALPDYLLAEGIPEPVAAAASLMLTEEAQRELFLVVDVGAGTTDYGLFLLQHNPDRDVCLVRIVPNTVKVLEQAGNRVDDLLKFFVLELEGIDKASPEGAHNLSFLQSTIRLQKEALFRDGQVEIPLANRSRAIVHLDAFLDSSRVKAFSEQLQRELLQVLSAAGDGYLDLMADSHLNVVLTGGGADLPMVQDLARGVIEVRGRRILRKAAPQVPLWVAERYPQFAPQYSQLAVAIGGANPEIPGLGPSFEDFKGLRRPTYTA
jgi:molecular chaperone HscA